MATTPTLTMHVRQRRLWIFRACKWFAALAFPLSPRLTCAALSIGTRAIRVEYRLGGELEEIKRLRAERDDARALLRRAHDAMMDWHMAHGKPGGMMTREESAMGDVCRAIQGVIFAGPPTEDTEQ